MIFEREILKRKVFPFNDFQKAEAARSQGLEAFGKHLIKKSLFYGKEPQEKIKNCVDIKDQLAALNAALDYTARENLFVDKLGDSPLFPEERAFFQRALQYFAYLDAENSINRFSPQHVDTSTPIQMTLSGQPNVVAADKI